MRHTLFSGASALAVVGLLAVGSASPAMAGNIVLTGHDNDFHGGFGDANAKAAFKASTLFVINGSALPVLAIDAGSELTNTLSAVGISFVSVTPGAVTAASFDHTKYSAFVVASVTTCGGCDNPVGTGALLATFEPAIASFFNDGGGIYGLTGANDPTAFTYVPEATTGSPIFNSSGFVLGPDAAGIPGFIAVNGDQTHNTFSGFGSFYKIAETFGEGGPAVTIYGSGGSIGCVGTKCTITGGGGVPEPSTWALLGVGFFGLGVATRRARKNVQLSAAA